MVPKPMRDELGMSPGLEIEIEAVDGRIEISIPSRVEVRQTARGPVFSSPGAEPLTTEQVRELIDQDRRRFFDR